MKKLFFLIGILSSSLSVFGQKANDILEAVHRKYTSLQSYSATFLVSGPERYSGSILVKGKKYKISMEGQEVYNNGKEVYTYLSDANEATITHYQEGDEGDFSPSNVFSLYKKGYSAAWKEEVTKAGKKYDVVTLTPKTRSSIRRVDMTIGKADRLIASWTVYDQQGVNTYTVSDFKPNVAVTDAAFTFDRKKYPRVEVIDLR